jgi:hypothetical protein
MNWLHSARAHQVLAGAITGLLTAAEADFDAFRRWQSWGDAAAYDWKRATFRWCKGLVIGAASGLGLGAVFGA